jgi:type I restriction enzyme S subunit
MSEEATLDEFVNGGSNSDTSIKDLMTSLDETSVGRIPSDWSAVRLENLTENTLYGANESAEDYDPDKPRYIRIKDIDEQGRLKQSEKASLSADKAEGYLLEEGDMLFARSGSPGRTYLHRNNEGKYCYGGYSIKHELISEGLNHEYLSQYTKSQKYWDWIERIARTGAQANINSREYASLLVPLPSLSEQRKIATILYTVDRAIEKTEEVSSQLGRLKQGLCQRLFFEGVEGHTDFKESKYGKVPENWNISKLSEVTSQIQAGSTPDTDVDEYYGGSIPWVKTGELSQHRIRSTEQTITQEGYQNSATHMFAPGTVLIAMYGATTGEVSLLELEATTNQACCGVVTSDDLVPEFLYQQLNYFSNRMKSLSAGSGQQNISKGILEKFNVLVPPVEEQNSIVEVLAGVDESISENRATKEQLQRLKEGLQQDLLSGTVRTTDTNIEVPDEIAQHG